MPCLFYFPAKFFYIWWIQWEIWYNEQKWIMLEIVPPAEVQKPFRAMEDIFAAFWPIYDKPNWREQWCEGEFDNGPFWFSLEIVSLGGDIHFYSRVPDWALKLFEAVVHAHYPEAEIFEVEDYTQNVPQNLPNKDIDVYGEDYVFLKKEHAYPIKTYKFFEIKPEEIEPEKKLDPIFSLLESMAKLRKGEQYWFQMVMVPMVDEIPWKKDAEKIINELTHRKPKDKSKSITAEAFRLLAYGDAPFAQEEEKREIIPSEMRMTPGERDVVAAVEEKVSKLGFKTHIRAIYLYTKEAFVPAHKRIARGYFLHFADQSLNSIRFLGETRAKIHYLFRKRRLYSRKKRIFEKYIKRFPPKYPDLLKGTMALNPEELATIFHLPMSTAGLPPTVPRIMAKKGGPPPSIPTEEL